MASFFPEYVCVSSPEHNAAHNGDGLLQRLTAATAASWPSGDEPALRLWPVCSSARRPCTGASRTRDMTAKSAVQITGPWHRHTDKLALTVSIGDSGATRPVSVARWLAVDLAGSLCQPQCEQSLPVQRMLHSRSEVHPPSWTSCEVGALAVDG